MPKMKSEDVRAGFFTEVALRVLRVTLIAGVTAATLFAGETRAQGMAQNVVWVDIIQATATGSTIQKTGTNTWGDAGAHSQQQITGSGFYVEFTPAYDRRLDIGMSTDASASVASTNMDYAFNFWPGGTFDVREKGVWKKDGTFMTGAVFRIVIDGATVTYYQNGAEIYSSTVAPTYPMVLDLVLSTPGAIVSNAAIFQPTTGSIKTDRSVYNEPPLPALPPAGGKLTDPTFGTEILRVTDEQDGQSNGTFYAYWPTFNSDNTRLLAKRGSGPAVYAFNPETFTLGSKTVLPALPDGNVFQAEGAMWSTTNPNILYGVTHWGPPQKLWVYDASTNSYALVRDFSGDLAVGEFLWQLSMSEEDGRFAFTVKSQSTSEPVGYIVYQRTTNQILLKVTTPFINGAEINEVQLDKSGRYLVIPLNTVDAEGKKFYIRDLQAGTMEGITYGSPDYSLGHPDSGTGMQVGWDGWENRFLYRDLVTPHNWRSILELGSDWTQSIHTSLRGSNEMWALVSLYSQSASTSRNGVFHNELILVSTDCSQRIRRVVHHRSVVDDTHPGDNYFNEPHANLSRNGRFIAFTSNWGGSNRQDLFIVRIPLM
jgi:hypothetical protein